MGLSEIIDGNIVRNAKIERSGFSHKHDLPSYNAQRGKTMAATETKKLKQKLTWLTGNVLVCGKNYGELPDVEVSNLKKT